MKYRMGSTDHLIKTFTEVVRWMLQENGKTKENDVTTEPEAMGKRSSVSTGENEMCPNDYNLLRT